MVVTEDDHFNVGGDGEGGSGGGADHDPVQDMIACDRPIEFVPHSMSKYGMDAYRDPPVTGYQTLTTGTQVTGIGWKAMSTDETGMLRVQVNDSDADELNFQYQSGGTGVSADGDATSGYTLSLQAPPGNEDILLAVCNRDTTTGEASIAGGIGVAAYERFALELKVVPVGHELNYTQEQLEEALNDIYGQAVVSWDVEYLPALDINYWDENGDGLIERPNTDYSNEMRAVWESFLASMQYDPVQQGQAYLFVIPGITEGGDVRGYMPIKSRYGFVTADATTRDVAHELGHGVFNLRHTFSEENSFTLPQGETDNLMDYSTGTELWKYQWDFIHNPEGGWHIFEDVEEGEIIEDAIDVISGVDYVYIKLCNTTISGDENQTTTTEVYKFIGKNENGYVVGEITIPDFTGAYPVINEQDHTEAILIFSNGSIISICEPQHDYSNFCELEDPVSDNTLISNFEDDVNNCRQTKAIDLLSQLNQLARSTQKFELEIGGKVYELQGDNLVEITTSIEDINQGNWSNASVETRMRVGLSDGGIYQYSAFGIHKDITVASIENEEKVANVPAIAANMRNKANACFEYYEVKDIASTLNSSNGSLDNGEFPGGGNLQVSKNVSFFKIICEAGGVGVEFLKTGLIEQPVYFEDQDYVIKAPGILTGTLEGAAIAVTDITSIVSVIFDVVTDSDARSQAVNGFISIKNQIVENPSIVFSLLFEIALEEVTGSDSQGFKDMVASNTNGGRKKHLISKTSIRTASSVFLGGAFLAKLGDFALEVATKLPKAKLWARFRSLDGSLTDDLLAKLDDLPDGGNSFLNDFATVDDDVLNAFLQNPDLVESWKKLDNLGADEVIRRNPGALDALTKKDAGEIVPNPSTYLDADYIANHLDNFDGGVTKITSYDPTGAVGPPGGTFVLPKSMADDLIAQAGGNINNLEDLLGLNRGDLGANPFRVDVDNPSGLRMPSGNEPGANEFWIPGGKTSGGILEATVDQIQPGTFTKNAIF
ncbi:hypothetical protein L21SP5_00163 [Salinivirga cyanobacteriivorans]|uniref:Uncharacterized protein n=1 Tax=Salinivirga cyanobacteriivorans TaxID=1307839 RepID=A0A0S2HUV5_9BACT|nr:hypothetical protein L21SP5_00163 [Salinivirga cyanobacteriivorans]